MTGFVSLPPNTDAQPPEALPPEVVANDGFWPDVDMIALRDAVHLDTTISSARLRDAIVNAMLELARTFGKWRALNGVDHDNLQAVPARVEIGGVSDYVILYTRALYSLVGADLGERLLSQSTTAMGGDRRDELTSEVDQHRRNARWAQNDFLGKARSSVELL